MRAKLIEQYIHVGTVPGVGNAVPPHVADSSNGKRINEDAMGGVSAPMATLNNTPGMGNVVPAGVGKIGSGDKWSNTVGGKPYTQAGQIKKKKKKTMKKRKYVKEDLNESILLLSAITLALSTIITSYAITHHKELRETKNLKDLVKHIFNIDTDIQKIIKRLAKEPEVIRAFMHPKKYDVLKTLKEFLSPDEFKYIQNITLKKLLQEIPGGKIEYNVDDKDKTLMNIQEENTNPYNDDTTIGKLLMKGKKSPFKKIKSKKNQNAMVQRNYEHKIATFDEFRNQMNENK